MIADNYTGGVIIVYSMPRSGTTLLCEYLAHKLHLLNAGEIFHPSNQDALRSANEVLMQVNEQNQDFVCKYFPADKTYDHSKFNGRNNFYKINLVRENLARQFTSYIIASATDEWQTHAFGKWKSDLIRHNLKIDQSFVKREFDNFIYCVNEKEKYDKQENYDQTLVYEDIVDYLNKNKPSDIRHIPSVKPTNYNSIYIEVIRLLKAHVRKGENVSSLATQWYENFQKNGFKS